MKYQGMATVTLPSHLTIMLPLYTFPGYPPQAPPTRLPHMTTIIRQYLAMRRAIQTLSGEKDLTDTSIHLTVFSLVIGDS